MVEMHNLFQTQNPCHLVLHILLGLHEGVPTHPREEGKLKTTILHTVGMKICHRHFSNNAVPDLNKNIRRLTDLAKK